LVISPSFSANRYSSVKRFAAQNYVRSFSEVLQALDMQTNDETRLRRLKWLCEQEGGVRAVAARADLGWQGLDQILKGVPLPERKDGVRMPRALGNEAARAIEAAFDLGRGWFDWPFDAVGFKSYERLNDVEKGFVQAQMANAIKECSRKRATRGVNLMDSQQGKLYRAPSPSTTSVVSAAVKGAPGKSKPSRFTPDTPDGGAGNERNKAGRLPRPRRG
jgi:hypothetical protein